MEFVLSKLSLVAIGVVLVAAVSGMFDGLDDTMEWRSARECVSRISEILNTIESSNDATSCRLVMSEFLPSRDSRLDIAKGSIWLIWGNIRCVAETSSAVMLYDGRDSTIETDTLSCGYDDEITVEYCALGNGAVPSIHIEKVSTSPPTALTNLSHSAIVLYM